MGNLFPATFLKPSPKSQLIESDMNSIAWKTTGSPEDGISGDHFNFLGSSVIFTIAFKGILDFPLKSYAFIVYVPGALKEWETFLPAVIEVPSPKSHLIWEAFALVSTNFTSKSGYGLTGISTFKFLSSFTVNFAFSGGGFSL